MRRKLKSKNHPICPDPPARRRRPPDNATPDPDLTAQLVRGVSDGCLQAGCSLVGGETAILPDFYAPGDFDMAGFCAGVVDRDRVIDGRTFRPGDVLIGLASSGVHSNGFSLVRKVLEAAGLPLDSLFPGAAHTLGEELLTPTRIYVKAVRGLLDASPGPRLQWAGWAVDRLHPH